MDNSTAKIALVTGARTGIGRACAVALAEAADRRYIVYGTSRRSETQAIGDIRMLQMNVDDTASVRAGVQRILDKHGRIDVVVNNAGIGFGGPVEGTSEEEAKATFETNFFGALRVCQAVLPAMRAQGSGLIINVSSVGGLIALPYQGLYSASKFALEALTLSLRMEVKQFGVNVVLLEPGDTRTSFTDNRRFTTGHRLNEAYAAQHERAMHRIEEDERHGAPPEAVARTLMRIVRNPHPKPQYVAARFYEKAAIWARRLLPGSLFEWIIAKNYDL